MSESPEIARTATEVDEVISVAANAVEYLNSEAEDNGRQRQSTFADGAYFSLLWLLGLPSSNPVTAEWLMAELDATYPFEMLEELRQAERDPEEDARE